MGVTFRTRSLQEVREVVRKLRADLWEALVAGHLRLPIDKVFPFDAAREALDRMAANQHFGKIVLKI
jgi:NADPH2:quinone reductase